MIFRSTFLFALLILTVTGADAQLERQPGYLHFEEFELFKEFESSMEFHIGESLLRLVAKAAEYEGSELAAILRKLKLIRSYTFDLSARTPSEVEGHTDQFNRRLMRDRWEVVYRTRDRDSAASIYLKTIDEKVAGFALLSLESERQITVVNIVGEVNLDELSSLAERFGFPDINNK